LRPEAYRIAALDRTAVHASEAAQDRGRLAMVLRRSLLMAVTGAAAMLLVLGFVLFAGAATREPASQIARADGIVVLTGGEARIAKAARLLEAGRADRLLISGVNRKVGKDEIHRLTGLGAAQFDCCVDIGYAAHDTIGNADETREWVARRGYKRLIVVTASYHMPRSLAELGRVLPGVELVAYPVVPTRFHTEAWWRHLGTTRILVSEYLKFLPAAARLAGVRLLRTSDASPVAIAGERLKVKS
jgi:uncharacterized SAM-binding protein YcdF (DUF218 family)